MTFRKILSGAIDAFLVVGVLAIISFAIMGLASLVQGKVQEAVNDFSNALIILMVLVLLAVATDELHD